MGGVSIDHWTARIVRAGGASFAMQMFRSRVAVSLAALAALSVTATPALAHGRDGWRPHRHYRGGGISGGGLLAGLLVVGGVAALASNIGKNGGDERDVEPAPYRYPDGGQNEAEGDAEYDHVPSDNGGAAYPGVPVADGENEDAQDYAGSAPASGSLGAAVDACEAELENGDKRVESVGSVRRIGERYSVEGLLEDGRPFACSVDETGHVRSVAVDGQGMI